ncbi:hypothetical protein [Cupriavidus sp. 8B]
MVVTGFRCAVHEARALLAPPASGVNLAGASIGQQKAVTLAEQADPHANAPQTDACTRHWIECAADEGDAELHCAAEHPGNKGEKATS